MKCYACGKLVGSSKRPLRSFVDNFQGHISRDCTAPNGGPLNAAGKTCYKCGQPGHISKDCTSTETNGSAVAVPNGTPADAAVAAPAAETTDISATAASTAAVA